MARHKAAMRRSRKFKRCAGLRPLQRAPKVAWLSQRCRKRVSWRFGSEAKRRKRLRTASSSR
eukprot:436616-Amphidinium_carterae.1